MSSVGTIATGVVDGRIKGKSIVVGVAGANVGLGVAERAGVGDSVTGEVDVTEDKDWGKVGVELAVAVSLGRIMETVFCWARLFVVMERNKPNVMKVDRINRTRKIFRTRG